MEPQLLIVEDDAEIREMLRYSLETSGYTVAEAADAQCARLAIAECRPDVLLVDWMMPGQSGIEFVRMLRRDPEYRDMPVLFLTARDSEEDTIAGLEAGADDYMTKPVSIRELKVRIKALLRRSKGFTNGELLSSGRLQLDTAGHRLFIDDQLVDISGTEYRLLEFFMSNPERVYSRTQLLDRIWGHGVFVEERTVDVHILRLRKLLKPHAADPLIQTVRGAGYRLSTQTTKG